MFRPVLLLLRSVLRRVVLPAGCLFLSYATASAGCQGEGLKFHHAQIRATPPNAPVSAGYLHITNTTGQTQTLLSAAAPFAQRAEIHDMRHDAGVMKMYEIKGGLAVPDGLTVALVPKGRHLMFIGLERQLKEDDVFKVTLEFSPCGQITLPFHVTRLPGPADKHKKTHTKGHTQVGHNQKHKEHNTYRA